MDGKTIKCVFTGNPGYSVSFGYGYWDNTASEWIQGDDTNIGLFSFNGSGEVTVIFEAPVDAVRLQVQPYWCGIHDAATDSNIETDLSEIELTSVTYY